MSVESCTGPWEGIKRGISVDEPKTSTDCHKNMIGGTMMPESTRRINPNAINEMNNNEAAIRLKIISDIMVLMDEMKDNEDVGVVVASIVKMISKP